VPGLESTTSWTDRQNRAWTLQLRAVLPSGKDPSGGSTWPPSQGSWAVLEERDGWVAQLGWYRRAPCPLSRGPARHAPSLLAARPRERSSCPAGVGAERFPL